MVVGLMSQRRNLIPGESAQSMKLNTIEPRRFEDGQMALILTFEDGGAKIAATIPRNTIPALRALADELERLGNISRNAGKPH